MALPAVVAGCAGLGLQRRGQSVQPGGSLHAESHCCVIALWTIVRARKPSPLSLTCDACLDCFLSAQKALPPGCSTLQSQPGCRRVRCIELGRCRLQWLSY